MKDEYDFSAGERGKFYHPDVELLTSAYDTLAEDADMTDVEGFLEAQAEVLWTLGRESALRNPNGVQ